MAKSKHRPSQTRPVVRPINGNCDDRLKRLAWELGIAGAIVLQSHFGFTKEQSAEWAKLTVEQAGKNRKEDIGLGNGNQIDNSDTKAKKIQ